MLHLPQSSTCYSLKRFCKQYVTKPISIVAKHAVIASRISGNKQLWLKQIYLLDCCLPRAWPNCLIWGIIGGYPHFPIYPALVPFLRWTDFNASWIPWIWQIMKTAIAKNSCSNWEFFYLNPISITFPNKSLQLTNKWSAQSIGFHLFNLCRKSHAN